MKRILREIIEIIRMKMGEIFLIFESLFYNSLILNFVFMLIQIKRNITRGNFFFLSFIDIFKRVWTERKCFFVREKRKIERSFCQYEFFVRYLWGNVLPLLLLSRYQSA